MRKNKVKSRRRRPLRGEALVRAAHAVLAQWSNLSPKTHRINISRLAAELGVTRQPIYDNKLAETVENYKALQQKNFSLETEKMALRRPLEQRVSFLESALSDSQRKLDGWIERWATVEYNARMLGIDIDEMLTPMPVPDRKLVNAGRGKRRRGSDE